MLAVSGLWGGGASDSSFLVDSFDRVELQLRRFLA